MEREVLGNTLEKLGEAWEKRKNFLERNSIAATEGEYLKEKIKYTAEEYIRETVGDSAEEYANKVFPPISDEKPTIAKLKKPSLSKTICSFGIFGVLLVVAIVLFVKIATSPDLATAAGVVCIAAIISFFIGKNKLKVWKSENEKFLAEQREIEKNIEYNKNRSNLIAEREAKLPLLIAEYPDKVNAARREYQEKIDAKRAEYQKILQPYNDKIAEYNDTIKTYRDVVETSGYAFPAAYDIFAKYLGGKILVEDYPNHIVEAVEQMFKENPDWRILLGREIDD